MSPFLPVSSLFVQLFEIKALTKWMHWIYHCYHTNSFIRDSLLTVHKQMWSFIHQGLRSVDEGHILSRGPLTSPLRSSFLNLRATPRPSVLRQSSNCPPLSPRGRVLHRKVMSKKQSILFIIATHRLSKTSSWGRKSHICCNGIIVTLIVRPWKPVKKVSTTQWVSFIT